MCSSHTAEHQGLANTIKPVGYPLALVNSLLRLWGTPQPLSKAGPHANKTVEAEGQCFELETGQSTYPVYPLREKLLPACKRETMPALAPQIAFFTEDLAVGLKLRCFLSSKDYFKLHREQLLNKLCKYRRAVANSFHLIS